VPTTTGCVLLKNGIDVLIYLTEQKMKLEVQSTTELLRLFQWSIRYESCAIVKKCIIWFSRM